jgi:hypothetical protein
MSRERVFLALTLCLACSACTDDSVGIAVIGMREPATRLLVEPGRLRPGVDSLALDSLLAEVPAGMRMALRASFEVRAGVMVDFDSLAGDARLHAAVRALDSVARMGRLWSPLQPNVGRASDLWRTPIRLVVVNDTSSPAELRVRRHGGDAPYDELIVRGASTVTVLDIAFRQLALVRSRTGYSSTGNGELRLALRVPSGLSMPRSWRMYLERVVLHLNARPPERGGEYPGARSLWINRLGQPVS